MKKDALFDDFTVISSFFQFFFPILDFFPKNIYFSLRIVGIVNRLPISLIEIQELL